MSRNNQPLEGLTVRIWDPSSATEDKDQDKSNKGKGSRGYRQYTEQVGSDKLKYSTHDWDDKKKETAKQKQVTDTAGLKKSTRNWDTEHKEKVQDLPLVSRSSGTDQGLRDVQKQKELWQHILQKMRENRTIRDKRAWEPIVILFRKLREGIYATHWSNKNYIFAIKVFQESVNASIKARDYGELIKSLSGLNELYTINKALENPYYTVLDTLYHLCYISNAKVALERYTQLENKSSNEAIWAEKMIKCVIVSNDPLEYFKLYTNNPYPAFRIMMDNYSDTMRVKAIDVLRKAYLSAPATWISKWIGVDPNNVVAELDRLVKPSCIKSVDSEHQIVYFLKKRNL